MANREPRAPQIAGILALHRIEASGPGEVSCHACRDKGWMDGGTYFQHVADAALPIVDAYAEQVRAAERERIAQAIWNDERKCQAAIVNDPTNAHLNGRLAGLQRARDIARAGGDPS